MSGQKEPPAFGPILFPFTGSGVGGSHISTFNLARSLQQDFGYRTVVIAPAKSSIEREAARYGLEFEASGEAATSNRSLPRDLARAPRRTALLAKYGKSAILHANDIWTLQSWILPAKLRGLPVIYHHRAFERMLLPNRIILSQVDGIISISEACRDNLTHLDERRVVSILNPFTDTPAVDAAPLRAEFTRHWASVSDPILIGFAANFQHRKRPEYFLDVCRSIAAQEPRARFVLFGRDRETTAAELMAYAERLGIGDKVFAAGFRSPPELNFAALDVFVAPALAEPFGRTLVESILVGTPYVATDDAGHSEIFRRWGGGLLSGREAAPEAFAKTVLEVAHDLERFVLTPEQRARVIADISPAHHTAQVLAVYEKARADRGR